jgi:hypothetical protein
MHHESDLEVKGGVAAAARERRKQFPSTFWQQLALLAVFSAVGMGTAFAATAGSASILMFPQWANVGVSTSQQFLASIGTSGKIASSSEIVWSVNGVRGGNSSLGTISASGLYSAPATPPSPYSLTITATSTLNPSISASVQVWVKKGATLNVYPKQSILGNSRRTVQLFSAVSGTQNTAVVWHVDGGAVNGTVSSTGLYTAPATPPSGPVSVIAQLASDSSQTDTAQIAVVPGPPPPDAVLTPAAATLSAGKTLQLSAAIVGTSNNAVTWGLSPSIGTLSASGLYTAPSSISTQTTITITATSVAIPTVVNAASVTLVPSTGGTGTTGSTGSGSGGSGGGSTGGGSTGGGTAPVTVAVSPSSKALDAGQAQQFTAAVSGSSNTSVTWSLNPAVGSISSTGLYTAPAAVASQQTVSVIATSKASASAKGTSSVTLYPAVAIATTAIPAATVSSAYNATILASGGRAPYTWTRTSGNLPAGVTFTSSGVLSGTPSTSGTFAFAVTATDANGGSASKTLSLTVAAAPTGGLTVLTNSLATARIGQPYTGVLKASGGSAPYTWSISGALPTGLTLTGSSGQISGTPTQSGQFPVTLSVKDPAGHSGSKSFTLTVFEVPVDAYGGFTSLPCPAGPKAHFYTQKIGTRWHLCTPAGNAFWMNSVYNVDATDSGNTQQGFSVSSVVTAKYATGSTTVPVLNWALQTVRRLKSWGFNSLSQYAVVWTLPPAINADWKTSDSAIPEKMPFLGFSPVTAYSMSNSGGYASQPVKDLMAGVKTSVFSGYRSQAADYWDPNFALYAKNFLANDYWLPKLTQGTYKDYMIAFSVDDTDYLQGFGAGPDFPTVAYGVSSPGYDQVHLGWVILVTAPTQTSNGGITYQDTVVYSKQKLSTWLSSRYGGSIAQLNAAWGSKYTTFGSAGGWGKGSGLLDEDGTCPARGSSPCWVPTDAYKLTGATAKMQSDLSAFLLLHAQNYFSTVKGVVNSMMPGVLYSGPTSLGTWGTPPRREVLQAASQYVDLLAVATLPPMCSNCADTQQRVDFVTTYGGDKPWISWEGFPANADSFMSPYAKSTDEFTTQAARGAAYQQRVTDMIAAADSMTGTHHAVGLQWWDMYDMRGEQTNWGLLDLRDNPYDGVSATKATGADSWGYPTGCVVIAGCEQGNYGNFITPVTNANFGALRSIAAGR